MLPLHLRFLDKIQSLEFITSILVSTLGVDIATCESGPSMWIVDLRQEKEGLVRLRKMSLLPARAL